MNVQAANDADWRSRPERSNLAILRLMVWISLRLGRPVGRLVLRGIAAYFLVFAPRARRASRAYLRRALGREPGIADLYRHVFAFAATIHDRVYLLNERFDLFDIRIAGTDVMLGALAGGRGVLLVGAHFGSFEVLRAIGRAHGGLRVAMLMYPDNARKINATLQAINPAATQDLIPLGRPDSMLQVRDRLQAGDLVGMLADRGIGGEQCESLAFLGAPASFPVGPWRMAAMLRCPVLFMAGVCAGANRYELHFEPLADFSNVEREGRAAAIAAAQRLFVERLALHCRASPYNWFNFFDFWGPEAQA
jgi:predicted LPLAT superfamily acyltransferase